MFKTNPFRDFEPQNSKKTNTSAAKNPNQNMEIGVQEEGHKCFACVTCPPPCGIRYTVYGDGKDKCNSCGKAWDGKFDGEENVAKAGWERGDRR